MVDRGVLSRFRQRRDLTAYHRQITGAIGQSPALRALPQLLQIALPVTGPDGALTPLRAALARGPYVTLAGRPGSAGSASRKARRWNAELNSTASAARQAV